MYINDILVLSKDIFEKNIYQLIMVFGILHAAGLQVNEPKWSFGLKEIYYLGYVITRDGINLDPKKLQGIMYLGRPATDT